MASNPSAPDLQPQTSPPPDRELAPLSEGRRLLNIFFAPSKTFTDLRRSANWWAPFLIIVIVSTSFVYVVDQKVGFRKVFENLIQLQPKQADRIERLPADQREALMRKQAAGTRIVSYAFPVALLVLYTVTAGILFASIKFGANAEVNFKTLFALVVYSRLPALIMPLLAILSLVAGVSGDAFNLENPAATNPGYFLDPSASPVLRTLLTSIDVFSIWTMILVAIGISCISKVKRGTAFAIVFGWWLLLLLIRVGWAAVTS
jgi:hypothetical protein